MKIQLHNGEGEIPVIGLGTYSEWGNQGTDAEMKHAVKVAIDAGYRHFDCAWIYLNQSAIGVAIEEKISEGVVRREELFITSKLWCTHYNPEMVKAALKDCLQQLRTPYLDMFLMHWPVALQDRDLISCCYFPQDDAGHLLCASHRFQETWKAMEECKKIGLTKNIGISNFNEKQITRLLDSCSVKPATNQIEMHPYLTQVDLRQFCRKNGIVVVAYSPFTNPSRERETPVDFNVLNEPILMSIAESKGKTVAQIILRWHVQCGVSVIPKSITPSRIQTNIQVFDFELTGEEMENINRLNRGLRSYCLHEMKVHPEYPFDEQL